MHGKGAVHIRAPRFEMEMIAASAVAEYPYLRCRDDNTAGMNPTPVLTNALTTHSHTKKLRGVCRWPAAAAFMPAPFLAVSTATLNLTLQI